MINPATVPPIDSRETLARYVLQRSHVRSSNQTVKPDAFIPHPHPDLSVDRHLSAAEAELWASGEKVAITCGKTLYGRADFAVADALQQQLQVVPAPVPGNPNHANVTAWPSDKPSQKIIASELAAAAVYSAKPSSPSP